MIFVDPFPLRIFWDPWSVHQAPGAFPGAAVLSQQSLCGHSSVPWEWFDLCTSTASAESWDHKLEIASFPSHGAILIPQGSLADPWSCPEPRSLPECSPTSEGAVLCSFSAAFLQMHPSPNVSSIIFVIIPDSCDSSPRVVFLHIITCLEQKSSSAAHLSANQGSSSRQTKEFHFFLLTKTFARGVCKCSE